MDDPKYSRKDNPIGPEVKLNHNSEAVLSNAASNQLVQIDTEVGLISSVPNSQPHPAYAALSDGSIRLLQVLQGQDGCPIRCSLQQFPLGHKYRPDYVALSYAWGSQHGTHEIFVNDQPLLVPKNLWRFLRQARSTGGDLSEWLWIDMLSINQVDLDERSHQVNLMSAIFQTAKHVNVWLGPSYHGSDTAMVALGRKSTNWLNRGHRRQLWASRSGPAIKEICGRPYWTRLWVFQELRLAQTVRLMCGAEIITWDQFRRFMLLVVADSTSNVRHLTDIVEVVMNSPAMRMVKLTSDSIDTHLCSLILATQELRCTDTRDKVYALLGIATRGHEIIEPDYSLPVPTLLNQLLREFHAISLPKSLKEASEQCDEIERVFGVQSGTIFAIQGQRGAYGAPSETALQACRLGPSGTGISLWWATFHAHAIMQELLLNYWQSDYFTSDSISRPKCQHTATARLLLRSCMDEQYKRAYPELQTSKDRCLIIKKVLDDFRIRRRRRRDHEDNTTQHASEHQLLEHAGKIPHLKWCVIVLCHHYVPKMVKSVEINATLQILFGSGGYLACNPPFLIEYLLKSLSSGSDDPTPLRSFLDAGLAQELMRAKISDRDLVSAAAYHAKPIWLQVLVDSEKFDVNLPDADGRTAAHYAASLKDPHCVRVLLACGRCDVAVQDARGLTPIIIAARKGNYESVALLLRHGVCDVNSLDRAGRTSFMYAAAKSDRLMEDLLLESHEFRVNARDSRKRTQLMNAVYLNDPVACRALMLIKGCDTNTPDEAGWTPLTLATFMLVSATNPRPRPSMSTEFQREAKWRQLYPHKAKRSRSILEYLLQSGRAGNPGCCTDVNRRDALGRSALIIAATYGVLEVVQMIADVDGCNLELMSYKGDTALACAQNKNHHDVTMFLTSLLRPLNENPISV